MRKIIYHPQNITESEDVVLLGASDKINRRPEPKEGEPYILDAGPALPPAEAEHGDFSEHQSTESRDPTPEQLKEMGRFIIEQATAEAARVIDEAHRKAQDEREQMLEKLRIQTEQQLEDARKQGYSEAFQAHTSEIIDCIKAVEDAVCRIESAQAAFITGYENDLKWMALEIAGKVLSEAISADQTVLAPLVMTAVRSVKSAKWMSVEISEELVELLSVLQQKVREEGLDDSVSFKLSHVPAESCVIETPDRFIDASVSRQLENLKEYFASEQH